MRIDFKNGGWVEGSIKAWDTCDCPTCTCPPVYLAYWKVYHPDGKVRTTGSIGADVDDSTSEEEKNKILQKNLMDFGVNIYDR